MSGRGRRKSIEDKEDVPHVSRPADTNMSSPRTRLGAESPNHIAKEELDDEDIKNLNTKKKKVKRPRSWIMFFVALAPLFPVLFGAYCYSHLYVFVSLCSYHHGLTRVVKLLLDNGADPNKVANQKTALSSLQMAVDMGSNSLVTMLLDSGANINYQDSSSNFTSFIMAVLNENEEIASTLIERGADLNLYGVDGLNALHRVCAYGKVKMVKFLLEKGHMDISTQSEGNLLTPLHWATEENHPEVVRILLEHHAPLGITDSLGQLPLHASLLTSDKNEILHMLLDAGSDPAIQDNGGMTALHIAYSEFNIPGAEILLEKAAEKIDVSATLDDGSTYLHWAALANHGKMIDELMVIGFSPHTPTASGETPLFWAVKMGNIEAMEKIINGASMQYEAALHEQENKDEDHGDDDKDDEDDEDDKDDIDKDKVTETNNDINGNNTPVEFIDPIQHKDETGNSLLHIASLHNQEILAENLIEMGFSVNEKNFDGKTPLWLACDVKNYGLGQTLVNKFGADPKIPSNEGTSIDMDCLRAVDDKNEPIVVEENSN